MERYLLPLFLLFVSINVAAKESFPESMDEMWKRISHEPNTFGYTIDGDDERFLDINISLKWSPVDNSLSLPKQKQKGLFAKKSYYKWYLPYPYVAFSTRQAFYFKERHSSPVIGKRFNPEFFGRYWLHGGGYIDISYNHESNGQSITTRKSFKIKQQSIALDPEDDPIDAKDFLSRGWDYWEFTWKHVFPSGSELSPRTEQLAAYFNLKHFASDGLFQDEPEEVYLWEPGGRLLERADVDGVFFMARWDLESSNESFGFEKLTYKITTGIDNFGDHFSNRLELGVRLGNVPLGVWFAKGYNDDLIDYYRNVKSYGVYLELGSF